MTLQHKTQPDILLLLVAATALLGVLLITAHHTYIHGYGLEVHFQENIYGILIAALVTIICVLEMAGWDWDRGYLDRVVEIWNGVATGKEKIITGQSGEKGGEIL